MPDTDSMLAREAFWQLIGTLGGVIDQESAQTLTNRLAAHPPVDIVAFASHPDQVLGELDDSERAAQLVVDPTVDNEPMTMSDDLFLYARCAVVAAGRENFDMVLADPARMAGTLAGVRRGTSARRRTGRLRGGPPTGTP